VTTWSPFAFAQHLGDLEILASSRLLSAVALKDLHLVTDLLELAGFSAGSQVVAQGAHLNGPSFVLEGRAQVSCATDGKSTSIGPSEVFGSQALGEDTVADFAVVAASGLRVACLPKARFELLRRTHPEIADRILRSATLKATPNPFGMPSAESVTIASLVPAEVGGALVVGARLRNPTVALGTWLPSRSAVEPLTVRDWEGREIYRRAAGLVFLEAAHRLGRRDLRLAASWTSGRLVVASESIVDRNALAAELDAAVADIISADTTIREETWDVDRAIEHYATLGWRDVTELLETSVESFIRLVSCGDLLLPRPGVMLPRTGMLSEIHVAPHEDGLSLDFGSTVRRELAKRAVSTVYLEASSPRYGGEMTKDEHHWLVALGITSVGSFNRAIITGEVRELISVAEGFQEKRVARLADAVRDRKTIRIIAVAGPSSSGKTTFLKRLRVQLEVNGIQPLGISLDDYYVDRERTLRDSAGEYDYEAYEAIDGELFGAHLQALLAGKRVKTARYDFVTGKSDSTGGAELVLKAPTVLVIEGIHALNPALLADANASEVFRVFIHPATALPFDPLTTFEPADVRLLRRIVRDRHSRGATAEQNLTRWPSVRRGERLHIYPHQGVADHVFDTSLLYEVSVLKVFAERYLLEVPRSSKQYSAAIRLRRLLAPFVTISPDHVPPTSILREFIGERGFLW